MNDVRLREAAASAEVPSCWPHLLDRDCGKAGYERRQQRLVRLRMQYRVPISHLKGHYNSVGSREPNCLIVVRAPAWAMGRSTQATSRSACAASWRVFFGTAAAALPAPTWRWRHRPISACSCESLREIGDRTA